MLVANFSRPLQGASFWITHNADCTFVIFREFLGLCSIYVCCLDLRTILYLILLIGSFKNLPLIIVGNPDDVAYVAWFLFTLSCCHWSHSVPCLTRGRISLLGLQCAEQRRNKETKKSKRDLLKGKFSITLLNLVDIRVFIVEYSYNNMLKCLDLIYRNKQFPQACGI